MSNPPTIQTNNPKIKIINRTKCLFILFKTKADRLPTAIPMIKGIKTIPTTDKIEIDVPPFVTPIMDIVAKKMTTPMISSIAARGIKVLVTGPSVLYSLTMDNAGAGAVARAIPPKIKDK